MSDNIARDTLEVLREQGWSQGGYADSSGLCMWGAARVATVGVPFIMSLPYPERCRASGACFDLSEATQPIIDEQYPERRAEHIPDFNDHPDTTFEDVERVLEKAALRIDEAVS